MLSIQLVPSDGHFAIPCKPSGAEHGCKLMSYRVLDGEISSYIRVYIVCILYKYFLMEIEEKKINANKAISYWLITIVMNKVFTIKLDRKIQSQNTIKYFRQIVLKSENNP